MSSFTLSAAIRGRRIIASFALSVLPFAPASAQQGLDAPTALPEIVVSPTSVPTPAVDVGSSVTTLTGAQIQSEQRRTVPDALQQVPGLNVVDTGGPGGQTSVFIRGTNSNHVKVFIDGIDASDPSNPNGSFDFGQLLTSDIDRIEVLRGPQSGLYGSDAIGGVISVFTKKGDGAPKAYARLEGGSFGTFNQTMGFSGGTPIYNYAFNVAHYKANDIPVTPVNLLPPGRQAIGNAYDNWTLSTKLGLHIGDSVYAESTLRYIDSNLRFTGDDFSVSPSVPAPVQSTQDDRQLFTRAAVHFDPVGTTIRNRIAVAYTQADTNNLDPGSGSAPAALTSNLGRRVKVDYQGQVDLLKGETLIGGAEAETDRLAVNNPIVNARNGNTAGYLQLLSNIGNRAFLVSNVRRDENDNFGGATTFRFALSFHVPVTETIIKGSYGTGFKAPTLSELYVSFPAFGFFANPNLKAETSSGYDIGFEQPMPGEKLSFGGTYFQNNITNLIDNTLTSYTNIGRAKTYGAESFAALKLVRTLSLRADYTFTIARDEILMEELLRRPRHKGSLQVFWTPTDHLTLSGTLIAIGRFIDGNRDFSIPRLVNDGHTTLNLAATYDIDIHTKLFARVDNILDLRYEDPTGFLGLRRAGYGGVQYTF